MANHKSAVKRIRQTEKRRLRNRYQGKTTRNLLKAFRAMKDKEEALKIYPTVCSKLDKLAKKNVIHKNKAANLKSSITLHLNAI